MAKIVNLSSSAYDNFLRCISILKDSCTDLDIKQGIIRQKTNQKSSIFEMDMTSILGDMNLRIMMLKTKIDLLKCLSGKDVIIEETDNEFIFRDEFSSLYFKNFTQIDNEFVEKNDFNKMFVLSDIDKVLDYELSGSITNRIRVVCNGFQSEKIDIIYSDDKASVEACTLSGDQHATFISDIPLERSVDNKKISVVTIPFIIDHDGGIKMSVYHASETISVNKFDTRIGDINISIYTRSGIKDCD